MFCDNCGKEFGAGERFCGACGNPRPEDSPAGVFAGMRAGAPQAAPAAQAPHVNAAAPASQAAPTNTTTAAPQAAPYVQAAPAAYAAPPQKKEGTILTRNANTIKRVALTLGCLASIAVIVVLLIVFLTMQGFVQPSSSGRFALSQSGSSLFDFITALLFGTSFQNTTMLSVSCAILLSLFLAAALVSFLIKAVMLVLGKSGRVPQALGILFTLLFMLSIAVVQSGWQFICPWMFQAQAYELSGVFENVLPSLVFPLSLRLFVPLVLALLVEAAFCIELNGMGVPVSDTEQTAQPGTQTTATLNAQTSTGSSTQPAKREKLFSLLQALLCTLTLCAALLLVFGQGIGMYVDGGGSEALSILSLILYSVSPEWAEGCFIAGALACFVVGAIICGLLSLSSLLKVQPARIRLGLCTLFVLLELAALACLLIFLNAKALDAAPAFQLFGTFNFSDVMLVLFIATAVLALVTFAWQLITAATLVRLAKDQVKKDKIEKGVAARSQKRENAHTVDDPKTPANNDEPVGRSTDNN